MPPVSVLALLLAAAPDLGLPAPPPAKPAGCPSEARVEVNLPAWRSALQQADSAKRRDELLAELKLDLGLPEGRPARLTLLGVGDTAVQLTPDARPDHIIEVRYAVDDPGLEGRLELVQVLRPTMDGKWCAIGTNFAQGQAAGPTSGYALLFVPLLSARAKAIQLERTISELRRSETRREYWVADGWRLRKIFDETMSSMESSESGSATTSKIGKVTLAGGFPRRIELREVTKHGGCDAQAGSAPCDDSEPAVKFTFVYDGSKYVKKR